MKTLSNVLAMSTFFLLIVSQDCVEAKQERWVLINPEVIKDSHNGQLWTRQDNQFNINWKSAEAYCEALALDDGGWRLPALSELEGLYDKTKTLMVACGRSTCEVTPLFSLSSFWFWSSDQTKTNETWGFNLAIGVRNAIPVSHSEVRRVLCVKSIPMS